MSTQKLMYCRNVEKVLDSFGIQQEKKNDPTGTLFHARCLEQFRGEICEALSDLEPRQARQAREAEAARLASGVAYVNLFLTDFARNYFPISEDIEDRFPRASLLSASGFPTILGQIAKLAADKSASEGQLTRLTRLIDKLQTTEAPTLNHITQSAKSRFEELDKVLTGRGAKAPEWLQQTMRWPRSSPFYGLACTYTKSRSQTASRAWVPSSSC